MQTKLCVTLEAMYYTSKKKTPETLPMLTQEHFGYQTKYSFVNTKLHVESYS